MSSNSINFLGTYSGITMDTIEQLLSAESTKLTSYKNEQAAVEKEKSAWKDVQTRLTNLATKMDALKKADTFNAKKATLSQEGKIGFTVGSKAIAGDYSITVKQLATRTEIKGKELQLDENKTWQKEGMLTFQTTNEAGEVKQLDIKIEAGDNLEKIVNKINDATKETGVSAVAIDGHLVLQNKAFGASNIAVVGELAKEFGFLDNEAKTMGKVAELTINGITIKRNSNQISDVMDGVTLDLKEETSQAIKVEIADDLGKTETAVKDFIDQYNSTMSFISDQLSVGDPSQENNETGALAGDSSLIRLQSQLRSLLTNAVGNGNSGSNTAKSIGIEVDRHGVASFDADKLKEALKADSSKVRDLFTFTKTSVNAAGETVEEEIGIGQKFESLINSFTDSKDGIIATKNATYDKLIKNITERITVFNDRLETKRQQYITKFTALDVAMMEAESQLSYMMSQFSNSSSSK